MKNFALVFKVLWRNQTAPRYNKNGKKTLSPKLMTAIFMLIFSILASFGSASIVITQVKNLQEVVSLIVGFVSFVQIISIFMHAFSATNELYGSSDRAFLNTLPIKPTSIFFAKSTLIYVDVLILQTALLAPLLITVGATYAVVNHTFFYGFFPLIPLICLLSPILPLVVLTALSMPIVWIGTFFKGKNVLKTVLSLTLYIGIMAAYFSLIYSGEGGDGAPMLTVMAAMSKVMYPNSVLVKMCLGIDAAKNFGITFGITIGSIVLLLGLSALFYRSISRRNMEAHAKHVRKGFKPTSASPVAALIKKDIKSIFRSPSVALQSFSSMLIMPVAFVAMYFGFAHAAEDANESAFMLEVMTAIYPTLCSIGCMGANVLANNAYTREGKAFYVLKTLPISPRQSLSAKLILSVVFAEVMLLIFAVVALIVSPSNYLYIILTTLCVAVATVGFAAFHIYCDVCGGNVNWTTAEELKYASNYKRGSLLLTFGAGIYGMIMFAVILTVAILKNSGILGEGLKIGLIAAGFSAAFVIAALICWLGLRTLFDKGVGRFDNIGENRARYAARSAKIKIGRNGMFGR